MREIRPFGSEGGAKLSFVPTPISLSPNRNKRMNQPSNSNTQRLWTEVYRVVKLAVVHRIAANGIFSIDLCEAPVPSDLLV